MHYQSVNPCRVSSSPSFSLSSSISSSLLSVSLSSSLLSLSLSSSLSLSVSLSVWCCVLCCGVCGVWCGVCALWCGTLQPPPCALSKRPSVCGQPRAHVFQYVRVVPVHTRDVLNVHTGTLGSTHGDFWMDTRGAGRRSGGRRQPRDFYGENSVF